ncbi:TolC family protein [Thiotrichales bacterium 19S3-7]|nr:TolC family protein [Thiotrichales bacterium 19S3-7]MCF6802437.1 TolC family protein [Thiotrichales bacterium 19S3-11]
MMKINSIKIITLSISFALIGGCSLKPETIKDDEQLSNSYYNLDDALKGQVEVNHTVSLAEAISRALKYNLDRRIQQSQVMLEMGNYKLALMEMLPSANSSLSYSYRNNNEIQQLVDNNGQPINNEQSFNPREVVNGSVGLQWNLLDLGLSYTRAQQQANRVLIAEEQRRKITQQLVQETTAAYWKAWTAQKMYEDVIAFKDKVSEALVRSKKATEKRASPSLIELGYQQVLIKSLRRMTQLQIQLSDAKENLARLMNVRPGKDFKLSEPDKSADNLPDITASLMQMDMVALVDRPELREASYQIKIAEKGIREAVLSMLPGVEYSFGYNYTNDQFMRYNTWSGGNVAVTWDLMQAVLNGPYAVNLAYSNYEFEQLKQAAVTMAVLSQVRIALKAYLLQREDYGYAHQEYDVTNQLFDYAIKLEKANQGNEQTTIRRGVEAMVAAFDQQVAFARAHEALARVYQAVGVDMMPARVAHMPLDELQKMVQKMLDDQSSGKFNEVVANRYAELMPGEAVASQGQMQQMDSMTLDEQDDIAAELDFLETLNFSEEPENALDAPDKPVMNSTSGDTASSASDAPNKTNPDSDQSTQ